MNGAGHVMAKNIYLIYCKIQEENSIEPVESLAESDWLLELKLICVIKFINPSSRNT